MPFVDFVWYDFKNPKGGTRQIGPIDIAFYLTDGT